MVNQYEVGFEQEYQRRMQKPVTQELGIPESATVNKYIEALEYKDASELTERAADLLRQNHPSIGDMIKDLGGERVIAHTFVALLLTCFEKLYKTP